MRSGDRCRHLSSDRPRRAALDLFDLGVDDFAGNGAGHEHDRAFVARNHAAARGRPLDGQANTLAAIHSDGRPKCCRTSRWMAARRDCA